jgi:hypothetical protein
MEIKATLACNSAVAYADPVIAGGSDSVPPTIWLPQRLPWNPGGFGGGSLWGYPGGSGAPMSQDFHVWTFAYDVSGLSRVDLRYRVDEDGVNPMSDDANEVYAGSPGVGAWQTVSMTYRDFPAGNFHGDPSIDFSVMPDYIADEYYAHMTGFEDVLLDYYVEAEDGLGHVKRSPIQHVWVGSGGGAPADTCVWWDPGEPEAGSVVTISYDLDCRGVLPPSTDPVYIHIGHSGWQGVISPDPAMVWDEGEEAWTYMYSIPGSATSVDFVFNNGGGVWDNNGGADWSIPVSGGSGMPGYDMDGALDGGAMLAAVGDGLSLYWAFDGVWLYLATESVGSTSGIDHFILVDRDPSGSRSAPWAKAGTVAGWEYFLGNEDDNWWSGWFDGSENLLGSSGAECASLIYLEGALDLAMLFGSIPDSILVAALGYENPDGGALAAQAPSGNGSGDVERAEYAVIHIVPTGIDEAPALGLALHPVAPNPSAGESRVRFTLPLEATVTVSVYDVRGRAVCVLADGPRAAGEHVLSWDGRDSRGRELASGIYFVRLSLADEEWNRKLVRLR